MYRVAAPATFAAPISHAYELETRGDGRHGQGTATQQSRDQETEEGQGQGNRRGPEPQGGQLAAGFRAGGEEEVGGGGSKQSPQSRCFFTSPRLRGEVGIRAERADSG